MYVKYPPTETPQTPPPEPKPVPSSSHSERTEFQETLNVPPDPTGDRLGSFPRSEPVEEAAAVAAEDVSEETVEAVPTDEDKAKLEEAMVRWAEMVECVGMLEEATWLSDLPDTAENAEALDIIFENGMRYCNSF